MHGAKTVADEPAPPATSSSQQRQHSASRGAQRLVSLDTFRGIAIAGMILVNNPGSWTDVYAPLQHSDWNGCTAADLIFPFFLFIVGVAISLSFANRATRQARRTRLLANVARRTLILFALGMVLNGFPYFDWSIMRIPGVLQRIALCYGCAALLVMFLEARGQAIVLSMLLLGYWAVMKLVPVPGFGPGGLGPGKNLAGYVDATLLAGHLLHRHWDPEGLLSTLPAIATTLSGVLTGDWLRSTRQAHERVSGLFVAGNAAIMLGLVLGGWFPINKSLWSSSYVLFTSGVALNLLALCYWLIDIKGYQRWAKPFVIYGTNPIVAYVLSSVMAKAMLLWRVPLGDGTKMHIKRFVFERFFLSWASPFSASLWFAIAYTALWLGFTAVLYRRRIFIKI